MGAKNKAPDPKPEITIPLAMPLLSGNHSIKASKFKNKIFLDISRNLYTFFTKNACSAPPRRDFPRQITGFTIF